MARRRRNFKKYWLAVLVLVIAVLVAYAYWSNEDSKTANTASQQPSGINPPAANRPSLPIINLQPTVDGWAGRQSGTVSVVVYDLANKKTVASLNPNRQYFTASIYKLYVAYEGYQKIADGTYAANEPYLGGYNRIECLDAMIRDSYSPCGEKWWNELGKQNLTDRLKKYGLKNTSMTGLYTSAQDAALVLQRLYERRDLTKSHANLFLDSMKKQDTQYRRGLPRGFSEATVYNKVGWNGLIDWHDTAIVTFSNGRSYVVAVLTERVGSAQVAALGRAIESRLTR